MWKYIFYSYLLPFWLINLFFFIRFDVEVEIFLGMMLGGGAFVTFIAAIRYMKWHR